MAEVSLMQKERAKAVNKNAQKKEARTGESVKDKKKTMTSFFWHKYDLRMLSVTSQRIISNITSITFTSVVCRLISIAQKEYEAFPIHKETQ